MHHVELKIVCPETHRIKPIGEVGELWLRGYQIMTGYHGQPEATAKTIIEGGWLRTGDLATMDSRGGIKLYPKKIEDTLFDHPEVGQIAVIGLPDEKWGEIVAAIILPARPEAPPSVDDLFHFARSRLSQQKTPERWFFVPQYPLTPTGKIQKNVLAEWIAEGRITPIDWVRPTISA